MNMEKTVIVGKVVSSIVSTIVIGEVFGGVLSRPIAAWRQGSKDARIDALLDLTIIMNQRICDLEDKMGEEAD